MGLIFSNIDKDDLVDCSELYITTFSESPWNEKWRIDDILERLSGFFINPKSIAIKAVRNGCICGFLFGKIQQYNGATCYDLEEICVSASIQRNGIGKGLMNKLEKILIEKKVSKIYLITQRDSVPSSFYASLSFNEIPKLMVMEKTLYKAAN